MVTIMTTSEFETLRADFAGMRTELTALRGGLDSVDNRLGVLHGGLDSLDSRLDALRADIDSRFSALRLDMETRFAQVGAGLGRLESKIDDKPGTGTIYQAALAMLTGMFAVIVGTLVSLKALGFLA